MNVLQQIGAAVVAFGNNAFVGLILAAGLVFGAWLYRKFTPTNELGAIFTNRDDSVAVRQTMTILAFAAPVVAAIALRQTFPMIVAMMALSLAAQMLAGMITAIMMPAPTDQMMSGGEETVIKTTRSAFAGLCLSTWHLVFGAILVGLIIRGTATIPLT